MYLSTVLPLALLHACHALKIATSLQWIEHTPQAYAIQHFYNGTSPATLVSGGVANLATDSSIDLAANAETQGLKQYANHKNLRLIYIITEVSYRLVARADAGIKTLADLKSKRIGSLPGTSASIFVARLLATAGVSPSQYTLVSGAVCMKSPCAASTLPSMLASRKIDAFGIWETAVELGIRAVGRDNVVVFQNATAYREVYALYTTTAALASPARRADITAFVRALNATRAVYDNPNATLYAYVADRVGADPDVVAAVWDEHKWTGTWREEELMPLLEGEDAMLAAEDKRRPMGRAELEGFLDGSIVGGL